MGLDREGRIGSQIVRSTAACASGRSRGRRLQDAVPEIGALLGKAEDERITYRVQHQVKLINNNGEERIFAVRFTREVESDEERGTVVTVDDITELVAAQRSSAWADVARRSHMRSRTPLTPNTLSRAHSPKYGK